VARARRRARAARGFLARLVFATTILAGLALIYVPQCADGMANVERSAPAHAHAHLARTAHPEKASARQHDSPCGDHVLASAVPVARGLGSPTALASDVAPPSPHSTGGVVTTCIVVLVMLLAAIVVLWPPGRRLLAVPRSVPLPCPRSSPLRRVTLAHLCVLRL
jgi:hypothetical protein